jgi:hypothetical protein
VKSQKTVYTQTFDHARADKRAAKVSIIAQLFKPEIPQSQYKYELVDVSEDELFFLHTNNGSVHSNVIECKGRVGADFLYTDDEFSVFGFDNETVLSKEPYNAELAAVIGFFRENGPFNNRSAISAYCYANKQAMLDDGQNCNYAFKINADIYVFYMNFNASVNNFNFYAYERSSIDQFLSSLTTANINDPLIKMPIAPAQEQPGNKPKKTKRMGIE